MTRALLVMLLAMPILATSPEAHARTLADVTMPERLSVQGSTLQLNGLGLRTFTFLHVHGYVAGLYVPTPAHDAAAIMSEAGPKLIRIAFVHAAGVGRVQDEFRDSRARICKEGCPKQDDAAFAQLLGTARAVHAGDTTTYIYSADGVQVLFNDTNIMTIHDPGFAQRMLAGMIGAHPPTEALRDGLLGG